MDKVKALEAFDDIIRGADHDANGINIGNIRPVYLKHEDIRTIRAALSNTGETQGGDGSVMRLLVRHIIQHKDDKFYGDWACKECYPYSDMLISGFKCGLHKAIEIDERTNTPGTPIEARKSQALGWASKAGATSPEEAEAIYKSYQKLKVDDEAARLRRATPSQGNSSLDAFWIVEQCANCVSDKPPREELRVIEIALQSTGGNKGDAE